MLRLFSYKFHSIKLLKDTTDWYSISFRTHAYTTFHDLWKWSKIKIRLIMGFFWFSEYMSASVLWPFSKKLHCIKLPFDTTKWWNITQIAHFYCIYHDPSTWRKIVLWEPWFFMIFKLVVRASPAGIFLELLSAEPPTRTTNTQIIAFVNPLTMTRQHGRICCALKIDKIYIFKL